MARVARGITVARRLTPVEAVVTRAVPTVVRERVEVDDSWERLLLRLSVAAVADDGEVQIRHFVRTKAHFQPIHLV
jgi:hypothetical protein